MFLPMLLRGHFFFKFVCIVNASIETGAPRSSCFIAACWGPTTALCLSERWQWLWRSVRLSKRRFWSSFWWKRQRNGVSKPYCCVSYPKRRNSIVALWVDLKLSTALPLWYPADSIVSPCRPSVWKSMILHLQSIMVFQIRQFWGSGIQCSLLWPHQNRVILSLEQLHTISSPSHCWINKQMELSSICSSHHPGRCIWHVCKAIQSGDHDCLCRLLWADRVFGCPCPLGLSGKSNACMQGGASQDLQR